MEGVHGRDQKPVWKVLVLVQTRGLREDLWLYDGRDFVGELLQETSAFGLTLLEVGDFFGELHLLYIYVEYDIRSVNREGISGK